VNSGKPFRGLLKRKQPLLLNRKKRGGKKSASGEKRKGPLLLEGGGILSRARGLKTGRTNLTRKKRGFSVSPGEVTELLGVCGNRPFDGG